MALFTSRKTATAVAAVAVIGFGAYTVRSRFIGTAFAEANEPSSTFGGKLGFASLKLHSVQTVNHKTRRLMFELPDKDAQSGLTLTCMSATSISERRLLIYQASLLTISRPQGSWLPVFRPYTPISRLGM